MIGRLLILSAAALTLSGAASVQVEPDLFLRLACSGRMIAERPEGSRIVTTGVVDFVRNNVRGFGIGRQQIVALTPTRIVFGSAREESTTDSLIDGWIDRSTWQTEVTVRSPDGARDLIVMHLDCEVSRPVS